MRRHMTMGPSMKHGQLPMPNRILRLQATVPGIPVPEFVLASSKKKERKIASGDSLSAAVSQHQTNPSSIQCLSSSYVGWPLQPCTAPHCQPPTFWRRAGGRERSRDASRSWGSRLKNGWEIVPTWSGISGRNSGLDAHVRVELLALGTRGEIWMEATSGRCKGLVRIGKNSSAHVSRKENIACMVY